MPIPEVHKEYAAGVAEVLGDRVFKNIPFLEGVEPMVPGRDRVQALLNQTWRPTLSYTGMDGMPCCAQGTCTGGCSSDPPENSYHHF